MTPEERIIVADKSASMRAVLQEMGYDIWKIPVQISCPVHKLGGESRPSARLYEDDKAVWCFFCVVQYSSTEVWASRKDVTREEAAVAILEKWPVSEDQASLIIRRSRVPYHPKLPDIYNATLERHLINHRGVAEFSQYRKWAKAVDDFSGFLQTLPEASQEVALQSFIERMNLDLSTSSSIY